MGTTRANYKQRARRARARARGRELDIGEELTVLVPCAHGNDGRHKVKVSVDRDGSLKSITCECMQNPPDPTIAAIQQALHGDRKLATCTKVVETFLDPFTTRTNLATFQAKENVEDVGGGILASLLGTLLGRAKEKRGERAGNAPLAEEQIVAKMRKELLRHTLTEINKKVCMPEPWRVELSARTQQGEWHADPLPALPRRQDEAIEKPTLVVTAQVGRYFGARLVATYVGRGRFTVHHRQVESLAKTAPRSYESVWKGGRRYCPLCNTYIKSLTSHCRSKKHQAAFTDFLYTSLDQIGDILTNRQLEVQTDE